MNNDNNKKFSVEERIKFYKDAIADAEIAREITWELFNERIEFYKSRIIALEKEKTGTKEKV